MKPSPSESVNDAFVVRVTKFIYRITSDTLVRRVASLCEYHWCDLMKRDVPDGLYSEVVCSGSGPSSIKSKALPLPV